MTEKKTEIFGSEIDDFIKNHLRLVRIDKTTWEKFYEDMITHEIWVVDYPQSELQGGGPPRLRLMT